MLALRTAPGAIRLALAALAFLFAVYAAELVFGFLPAAVVDPYMKWVSLLIFGGSAALCAARGLRGPGERGAWLLMGLGVLAWGLGLLYYTLVQWDLDTIPVPSLADAGYLMVYPPVYAALVLLYRARIRGRSGALWIDGAIGALAVGAIGAAVVLDAVLGSVDGAGLAAATNLSYPIADVVMLGLVVGVLAMTGWRRAGAWVWIAGGLAMFAVSDSLYFYGIALGTYEEGVIYDAGWPAAVLLLAYGAWTPASPLPVAAVRARREIMLPIVFAGASLGLLIYDHFEPTNVLALALASCLSRGRADAARRHPRRQPQDARRQPRGGRHRRAHRARQPPLADARRSSAWPRRRPRTAPPASRSSISTASSPTTTSTAIPPATPS